jgi:pimeloyl-ACP methyl ester carboxylesterase
MVMGAGNDVFVPPWIAEATAQYYQADRLHIFPDTAHAVMLEPHWEEVAESLSAWLDTLAEDTGSRSAA